MPICGGIKDIKYIFCLLTNSVINPITKIIIALAFVYFLWGVGKYLKSPGDPKSQEGARDTMIWGLLALFAMVSVWGLAQIITSTFRLENNRVPTPRIIVPS